jgi:ketosteroid isomerase-like protein
VFRALLLIGALSAPAEPRLADDADLRTAVHTFLTAFENLDWAPFSAALADDVTAFFPPPEPSHRFDGRAAVEGQFRKVFQSIRAGAAGGPPYHRLEPVRLTLQGLGPSMAIVTFELHNLERTGRRTLVMRRQEGGWKIVHLHASNVPMRD